MQRRKGRITLNFAVRFWLLSSFARMSSAVLDWTASSSPKFASRRLTWAFARSQLYCKTTMTAVTSTPYQVQNLEYEKVQDMLQTENRWLKKFWKENKCQKISLNYSGFNLEYPPVPLFYGQLHLSDEIPGKGSCTNYVITFGSPETSNTIK